MIVTEEHSRHNLEPVARLAHYSHRKGLRELICLPGGETAVMILVKSVLRPCGDYWLHWQDDVPARLRKRGVVPRTFVTSSALRAATPLVEWEARQARTAALL